VSSLQGENKGKNYTGHGAEEFSAVLSEM